MWSVDGRWLAYQEYDQGRLRLVVIRPDGSERREVALSVGMGLVRWSPDSRWIAFSTVYKESDGPITAIHLNLVNPFADDPQVHTLLRDLVGDAAFAWRPD